MLVTAVVVALLFGWANGVHDSSNAVAALVATRAARPGPAVVWAAVFHILGPLVVGTAVANTVGGIVGVPAGQAVPVVGAALSAALAWSLLTWWKGLPAQLQPRPRRWAGRSGVGGVGAAGGALGRFTRASVDAAAIGGLLVFNSVIGTIQQGHAQGALALLRTRLQVNARGPPGRGVDDRPRRHAGAR